MIISQRVVTQTRKYTVETYKDTTEGLLYLRIHNSSSGSIELLVSKVR